jgi:hypothetical protein
MRKKVQLISLVSILSYASFLNAQETPKSPTDTIYPLVEKVQSDVGILSRLKVSGYIQAQWQKSDSIGSPGSFSGGDFKGLDNRFMVRRGRIKFAYTNELSQYVLQFDVTEKGLGIKDVYATFTEPWFKTLSLTAGAFNRPFGYEIEYSSSSRETPERSRIFQTLFNQERDLGSKLTIQLPKTSSWNFIKIDAGLFTGNGLNPETDKYKDFIGHISLNKTFLDESLNVGVGASYYNGGWAAGTKYVYKINTLNDGTKGFTVDSATFKAGDKMKREYMGGDVQLSLQSGLGITTLRGEYIMGTQPGTASTSSSPTGIWTGSAVTVYTSKAVKDSTGTITGYTTTAKTTTPNSDAYIRNFSGGYIYFIQSIMQTKHELVLKYDWYDPNTKVASDQIGTNSTYDPVAKKLKNPNGTGLSDIKYSTFGLGWIYHWNSNVKITLYYEMVKNETTKAAGLNTSLGTTGVTSLLKDQKDNVFTVRVQYKF